MGSRAERRAAGEGAVRRRANPAVTMPADKVDSRRERQGAETFRHLAGVGASGGRSVADGLEHGMTAISPRQLAGILAWYAEAGVDCAISDVPTDWLTRATPPLGAEAMAAIRARLEAGSGMPDGVLAQRTDLTGPSASRAGVAADGMAARQPAHTPAAHPSGAGLVRPTSETARPPLGRAGATTADEGPRRFPTASPDDAGVDARRQAARAVDLADLAAIVTAFEGCALKATAKSTCVYRGASQARLAVIGDWLVDLHGPHEHQSLLQASRQLAILDAFGGLTGRVDAFSELMRERAGIDRQSGRGEVAGHVDDRGRIGPAGVVGAGGHERHVERGDRPLHLAAEQSGVVVVRLTADDGDVWRAKCGRGEHVAVNSAA